ncbi:MAG: glucose/arabinose dehydrogenase [Planctomycetota bacterium]
MWETARNQPAGDELDQPLYLTGIPGSNKDNRLFVVEKNLGVVRVIENYVLQPGTYLDLAAGIALNNPVYVLDASGHNGFMSMAFHPDFESNGRLFVAFMERPDGGTNPIYAVVLEYSVMNDVPAYNKEIFRSDDVGGQSHGAGALRFLPDGSLLFGLGDGDQGPYTVGLGGTYHSSQDLQDSRGKLHRLLTAEAGFTSWLPANPYPPSEIWTLGLRNPYAFAVGPLDVWIADPGLHQKEEISRIKHSSAGSNLQWPCFEGTYQTLQPPPPAPPITCPQGSQTPPIHSYNTVGGNAIIGGVVNDPDTHGSWRGKVAFTFVQFNSGQAEFIDNSSPPNLGSITTPFGNGDVTGFGSDNGGGSYLVVGNYFNNLSHAVIHKIVEACDSIPIGNCVPNPNSTGLVGELCGSDALNTGQASIIGNLVRFTARAVPNRQRALLYMNNISFTATPFSAGLDCIGITDINNPAELIKTVATRNSMAVFDLDMTLPPPDTCICKHYVEVPMRVH